MKCIGASITLIIVQTSSDVPPTTKEKNECHLLRLQKKNACTCENHPNDFKCLAHGEKLSPHYNKDLVETTKWAYMQSRILTNSAKAIVWIKALKIRKPLKSNKNSIWSNTEKMNKKRKKYMTWLRFCTIVYY